MNPDAVRHCYGTIRKHSKSFALASRLLPPQARDRAVVVYAWCRRADDAIDLAGPESARTALTQLHRELDAVYAGERLAHPLLSVFQDIVDRCAIPRSYPEDLLAGMAMDVTTNHHSSMESLLEYCYCVAGTVGLMMCHVMGVTQEKATRNAVHLGMAMQLTNICRDVLEDWDRGRLYLPLEVLERNGVHGLHERLGEPFPQEARSGVAASMEFLLQEADRYYASGDAGLSALSWRCALSIRTARKVYAAIGERIRAAGCDPIAGRAIVPFRHKLELTGGAMMASLADLPRGASLYLSSPGRVVGAPGRLVQFPEDVLPV